MRTDCLGHERGRVRVDCCCCLIQAHNPGGSEYDACHGQKLRLPRRKRSPAVLYCRGKHHRVPDALLTVAIVAGGALHSGGLVGFLQQETPVRRAKGLVRRIPSALTGSQFGVSKHLGVPCRGDSKPKRGRAPGGEEAACAGHGKRAQDVPKLDCLEHLLDV